MGTATTRFRALGRLEVTVAGTPVALGAPKQRALLATLLLRRNEVVSRHWLVDALWGDDPPESATGSVQVYVHGLRRALGAEKIETHGRSYRLLVEPGEFDVDRFEQLLSRAHRALADGFPAEAEADLRIALALFTGPPLADLSGWESLDLEADRLASLRLEAVELRNDAQLALGRHDGLGAALEPLIAENPFRERLREQQMLALYRSGRQKEALDAYRTARRRLVDELGVEPGSALQELERAILRQDPSLDAASPRPRRGGRLPIAPTPLVGRRLEIAAITALLERDDVRLVTLTGPGGSGKTRLALAVAEQLASRLPDGAVFVDLAPVTDTALLAPTLGQALGLHDRDQPLDVAIADDLRNRAGLLVLDNFEQLLTAAPHVADLLRDSPRLLLIVTSRAPLRLSWEQEYPVAPLTPPDERLTEFESVTENDAVRLFAARARAVDPAFELTTSSAVAVAAICRRLDGLPLAIELAAARSKVLPPEAMVHRLDETLILLTGGTVDSPPRHRTITATLDWSYALLDDHERAIFQQLTVFAGGWTSDAAATVCAGGEGDPVSTLAALVDHSLVRRTNRPEEPLRFTMLETIREYALEHLTEAGEEHPTRRRHAEYFTSLAETAEEAFFAGADLAPVLSELEREHDNFRAALSYLHKQQAAVLELKLASSLALFWRVRAHLSEGRMWLDAALAHLSDVPPKLQAKALSNAGRLAYRQGDYRRAHDLHKRSLAISRSTGDLRDLGQALSDLGGVFLAEGQLDRAEALYTESANALRASEHNVRLGTVLANLGSIKIARNDDAGARSLANQALALQRATGDKEGRVFTHLVLARAAMHDSCPSEAEHTLGEALALIQELDYREVYGYWLLTSAELAWTRGDPLRAARLLGEAGANFERVGIAQLQAHDLQIRTKINDAALEALGPSAFQAALAEGQEASEQHGVATRDERKLPTVP